MDSWLPLDLSNYLAENFILAFSAILFNINLSCFNSQHSYCYCFQFMVANILNYFDSSFIITTSFKTLVITASIYYSSFVDYIDSNRFNRISQNLAL